MIIINEKTHNGIEDCFVIDSDNNKKILETTSGNLYNPPVYIVARRYYEYIESFEDKDFDIEPIVEMGMLP